MHPGTCGPSCIKVLYPWQRYNVDAHSGSLCQNIGVTHEKKVLDHISGLLRAVLADVSWMPTNRLTRERCGTNHDIRVAKRPFQAKRPFKE
ncbi:hypothetical protein LguiA_002478 [Lonicera macranthoides]